MDVMVKRLASHLVMHMLKEVGSRELALEDLEMIAHPEVTKCWEA